MTLQFYSWDIYRRKKLKIDMYPSVHCITIYNSQDMEAA